MSNVSASWVAEQRRRPILMFLFLVISVAGFVSGLALRPIVHQLGSQGNAHPMATTALHGVTTATATPPLAITNPESFALGVKGSPLNIAPGGSFTLSAHASLTRDATLAASSVSCSPALDGLKLTPPPPPALTDSQGNASWTIVIPATTPPGSYNAAVNARWGEYSYSAYVLVTVTN